MSQLRICLTVFLLASSTSLLLSQQVLCPIQGGYHNTSYAAFNAESDCEIYSDASFTNDSNRNFENRPGGGLHNYGWIVNSGTFYNRLGGSILNKGTFYNSDGTLTNSGDFINHGNVANYSYFYNDGTINNISNLDNLGLLRILGGGELNNSGTVSTQSWLDNLGTMNNYANGSFLNTYELTIESGGALNNAGSVSNSDRWSRLSIVAGGGFTNSGGGNFSQAAGMTRVEGTLTSSTPLLFQGGLLEIAGTVNGDITMGGWIQLQPEESGLIRGNYVQSAAGTFLESIETRSVYGQLNVRGSAVLDGTLAFNFITTPNLGDTFTFLTFESSTGQFSNVDLPQAPPGDAWLLSYNVHDITLSVVASPEPSTLSFFGCGLIGIAGILRRKLSS